MCFADLSSEIIILCSISVIRVNILCIALTWWGCSRWYGKEVWLWKLLSYTLRCSCLDPETLRLCFVLTHTFTSQLKHAYTHSAFKKKKLIHLCMPWQAEPAVLCWFNTVKGMLTTSFGMLHSQAVDSQSCCWEIQTQGLVEGGRQDNLLHRHWG